MVAFFALWPGLKPRRRVRADAAGCPQEPKESRDGGAGGGAAVPPLPAPRGTTSAFVLDALRRAPHELTPAPADRADDPIGDDDLQLALYVCYELHYRGFDGVDERWEWEPSLLALRARLEAAFERALEEAVPPGAGGPVPAAEAMDVALRAIADADDGPSLSRHLE